MAYSKILSAQVQEWYEIFNRINTLYGPGTIASLAVSGINPDDQADDTDINNLLNKITTMRTDPYFASEPTLYTSYSLVSDGQIIQYGEVYEKVNTMMNNINRIVCRNRATNAYGNNSHGTKSHGNNTHGTNSHGTKSNTACTSNGSHNQGTDAKGTWGYGGHVSQGCSGNVVHYTNSANSITCSNGSKNNGNKGHGTKTNCGNSATGNNECAEATFTHGACNQGTHDQGTCQTNTAKYNILCANTTHANSAG